MERRVSKGSGDLPRDLHRLSGMTLGKLAVSLTDKGMEISEATPQRTGGDHSMLRTNAGREVVMVDVLHRGKMTRRLSRRTFLRRGVSLEQQGEEQRPVGCFLVDCAVHEAKGFRARIELQVEGRHR